MSCFFQTFGYTARSPHRGRLVKGRVSGRRLGLIDYLSIGATAQGGPDIGKKLIDAVLLRVTLETGDKPLDRCKQLMERRRAVLRRQTAGLFEINDSDDTMRRLDIVRVGGCARPADDLVRLASRVQRIGGVIDVDVP